MAKPTALIDGDILIYRAALAAEHPIDWGEGIWTLHAYMDDAITLFDTFLGRVLNGLKTDKYIVCLTDKTNFRKSILPSYKSNRTDKRPPMLKDPLREHVLQEYETFMRPGLEADDILGILATNPRIVKGDKVIATVDKDLKSVPGKVYNIDSGVLDEITEAEADLNHMIQALIGDPVDGYSGCPGIGKVKAGRLLGECGSASAYWSVVVGTYEKAGLNEAYALAQARVARILRSSDYDYREKRPILWTPEGRPKSE